MYWSNCRYESLNHHTKDDAMGWFAILFGLLAVITWKKAKFLRMAGVTLAFYFNGAELALLLISKPFLDLIDYIASIQS